MYKKRIVTLIIAGVFVAMTAFTGCSKVAPPAEESGAAQIKATPADTGKNSPNAKADGSIDLEKIAFYDPDFDYTENGSFKVKYLTAYFGPFFSDANKAIEHWAGLENIQYDGMWSSDGDNTKFLNHLQDYLDQGYDGLIIDSKMKIYPDILEILGDYPEVQWTSVLSPLRDTGSDLDPPPLQHPFAGHEDYAMGMQMMDKCVEYADGAWKDLDWDKVGVIGIDYSIVPELHDRQLGAQDEWNTLKPEYADNFYSIDGSSYGLSINAAADLVEQKVKDKQWFTNWLIVACFDDYAYGASKAIESLGVTDNTCIANIGGAVLAYVFNADQNSAWQFELCTAPNIYLEPIVGALYAWMAGYATPDTIWPQWINQNDCGADGHTYASYMLPATWIDKGNYKKYLAWADVYSQANNYSNYPRGGISPDDFTVIAEKPDYYDQ